MKKRKAGIFIIWILWMILIFWLSAQPDTVSENQSMRVGELICSIVINGFRQMEELQRMQYIELIDHIVRKSAHFCEYMILGGLTFRVFQDSKWMQMHIFHKIKQKIWVALLWCGLYALADEIHQLFVPGRFGSIWDVLLDLAGALTGIIFTIWLVRFFKIGISFRKESMIWNKIRKTKLGGNRK